MISNETVLVLGAGASLPYGFPTGRKLLDLVCTIWSPYSDKYFPHEELGFTTKQITEFIDQLRYSAYTSVDAFLEANPQFLEIGKTSIATALIPFENPAKLFPPNAPADHWYQYLVSHIGFESPYFSDSKLSILSFNYDRSLEHYLFMVLKNRYHTDEEGTLTLLKNIPIVHLHGSLGNYPGFVKDSRDYDICLDTNRIKIASDYIRIVHEADDKFPEFEYAESLLNSAKRIYFLGFGYHPTNIRRLQVFNEPWSDERRNRQLVIGTTYGISDKDWPTICEKYFNNNIDRNFHNHSVYGFLSRHVPLD